MSTHAKENLPKVGIGAKPTPLPVGARSGRFSIAELKPEERIDLCELDIALINGPDENVPISLGDIVVVTSKTKGAGREGTNRDIVILTTPNIRRDEVPLLSGTHYICETDRLWPEIIGKNVGDDVSLTAVFRGEKVTENMTVAARSSLISFLDRLSLTRTKR